MPSFEKVGFENVGEVIHVLRIVRGLSQGDLADLSGVRNSSISNYERGKSVPKLETLRKLADGLELSLSDMEETERFIHRMRRRRDGAGEPGSAPAPLPTALGELPGRHTEIDRLSAEAGRLVSRLTRVGLEMLATGGGTRRPAEIPAAGGGTEGSAGTSDGDEPS